MIALCPAGITDWTFICMIGRSPAGIKGWISVCMIGLSPAGIPRLQMYQPLRSWFNLSYDGTGPMLASKVEPLFIWLACWHTRIMDVVTSAVMVQSYIGTIFHMMTPVPCWHKRLILPLHDGLFPCRHARIRCACQPMYVPYFGVLTCPTTTGKDQPQVRPMACWVIICPRTRSACLQ